MNDFHILFDKGKLMWVNDELVPVETIHNAAFNMLRDIMRAEQGLPVVRKADIWAERDRKAAIIAGLMR
jgi:hypothetical protein